MLDKLFGSKARVKLLKLFLLHPHDKFYIREIARHLVLQLNSVHRELTNLEEIGLIISSTADDDTESDNCLSKDEQANQAKTKVVKIPKKQEKKYYQANTDFVFYKEIKALMVKAQILYEKDFTKELRKVGNIRIMILTGLFMNDLESAIDLFLVGSFNKVKLAKVVKDLEKDLVREVNYAAMTEEEFRYRREIADIFLYNIIDNPKIVVIDELEIL
ncbi:MAG: hypothetical protein V1765_02180 [bacterium]